MTAPTRPAPRSAERGAGSVESLGTGEALERPKRRPSRRAMGVYRYICSSGHEMEASHELDQCPAGRCTGTLRRVGPGSRTRPA